MTPILPDTPLPEAAAHTLPEKFETVLAHLAEVAAGPNPDAEHVHKLRVATRRASAAMRLFDGCLPNKLSGRLEKILHTVRRAAGRVRDWDVLTAAVANDPALSLKKSDPARGLLLGAIAAHRALAAADLVVAAASGQRKLSKRTSRLADKIADTTSHNKLSAADAYALRVVPLRQKIGAMLDDEAVSPDDLHRIRLRAKRLRYSIEALEDAVSPEARETALSTLKDLQEHLGHVTDAQFAATAVENLLNSALLNLGLDDGRFIAPVRHFVESRKKMFEDEGAELNHVRAEWKRLTG